MEINGGLGGCVGSDPASDATDPPFCSFADFGDGSGYISYVGDMFAPFNILELGNGDVSTLPDEAQRRNYHAQIALPAAAPIPP